MAPVSLRNSASVKTRVAPQAIAQTLGGGGGGSGWGSARRSFQADNKPWAPLLWKRRAVTPLAGGRRAVEAISHQPDHRLIANVHGSVRCVPVHHGYRERAEPRHLGNLAGRIAGPDCGSQLGQAQSHTSLLGFDPAHSSHSQHRVFHVGRSVGRVPDQTHGIEACQVEGAHVAVFILDQRPELDAEPAP